MPRRKLSEKYNDSCLKIFELLGLLAQKEVPFSDVIQLFADENGKVSQISNVVLNKYMNTLRIFGVEYKKVKNKYYLIKMPFSITLSEKELYTVALLKSAINFLPEGKQKNGMLKLIGDVEKRYDFDTQKLSTVISATRNYDLSFYFTKFEKQIEKCEQYCQDGNKIELYYVNSDGEATNMIAIPQEVKYDKDKVYLNIYNYLTRQNFDIPIGSIRNIRQLKEKSNIKVKPYTTVIFKLYGDLAIRYKLREWEHSEGFDDDGCQTIVNSGEDFDALAVRLFKYQENCSVISPKYLRAKISKMVEKTLKNYNI